MIQSASLRICLIDGLPVSESPAFKRLLKFSVRAAVKASCRVYVDFETIRKRGSDELSQVIDTIGYVPLNERSEAS